jgi:hypothetical protein
LFLSPVVDEAAAPASAVAKVEPATSAVALETVNIYFILLVKRILIL